jgi:hypothetical protein
LSAPAETLDVELLKVGETCQMAKADAAAEVAEVAVPAN